MQKYLTDLSCYFLTRKGPDNVLEGYQKRLCIIYIIVHITCVENVIVLPSNEQSFFHIKSSPYSCLILQKR